MWRILPLCILIALASAPAQQPRRAAFPFVETLRDFSAVDRSSKSWTLDRLKGRITYVYVWATWCAPCQQELPELAKLHRRLPPDSPGQILAIAVDDDSAVVDAYLADKNYPFPVIADHRVSDRNFPAGTIPATYLVNRDGIRTARYVPPLQGTLAWIEEDMAAAARRP